MSESGQDNAQGKMGRILAAALFISGFGIGCGGGMKDAPSPGGESSGVTLNCGPTEQKSQYMVPLPNRNAVRIVYERSEFSSAEVAKLQTAIGTWNRLHQSVYGRDLFSLDPRDDSARATITSAMTCDTFTGGPNELIVRRARSVEEWAAAGLGEFSQGVTIRCWNTPAGGNSLLTKQTLLIVPDDGRPGGKAQFASIVLHELGHSMGLDHSCDYNSADSDGRIGCKDVDPTSAYAKAIMFPALSVNKASGLAERKEALTVNDSARAECVWSARNP